MNNPNLQAELALHFSIFTTPEAHLEWENYIRYAREQTQFPLDVTRRWIDTLTFLRQELDEGFLRQTNHYHPLIELITGAEPWQVERLIQYTDILQYLASMDPDYPAFLEKLKAPKAAKSEAMDFLLIAEILHSSGLQVRFPKEILLQKNPDIVGTDPSTMQVIYAEISRMEESDKRVKLDKSYGRLYSVIHRCLCNPLYSAKQLHQTPFGYPRKLAAALLQLQKDVSEKNEWAEYEDMYFTIRLYPLSQEPIFNAWLEKEDRRKGLNGPPLNFDDTSRISGYKIREEAKHFRRDQAGLIFIPVNSLHFWQQHTEEAKRSFQYRLRKYPNIIGVYSYSEMLHPDAASFRFPTDDRFTRQQLNGPLTRYSFFVRNEAFNLSIHPATHQKILSALE